MPDEPADTTPTTTRIWDRRSTRRGLIAAGAVAAAGGTGAIVLGLARDGDDEPPPADTDPTTPGGDTTETPTTTTPEDELTPSPTPGPSVGEIADPLRRAGHLLRRAGFGGTRAEVEEFAKLDREEAADRLLGFESIDTAPLDGLLARRGFDIYRPGEAHRLWLTRMAHSPRPLQERMTLIWHGLLVSQLSQIDGQYSRRIKVMDGQIDLYRAMALPVYDILLKAVSKNPAMMIYLNTVESRAAHPNENYPRELMELFSMGEGNYSEDDVREAARAFTGWRIVPPPRASDPNDRDEIEAIIREWEPEFFVARQLHDDGQKTFLGKTGNWDGDDIIDLILGHEASSRFVTSRLFREFVHDHPSDETIDALTAVWDASGHDVGEVVRAILVSDEFYSEEAYRAKVRSPIELVVGAVRGLELDWDFRGLERHAETLGQVLYNPPNVAGWPGGTAWISSGTFFARANFLDDLFFNPRFAIPPGILAASASADEAVDLAVAALLDGNVPEASREFMVEHVAAAGEGLERGRAAAYLALASPEFQTI